MSRSQDIVSSPCSKFLSWNSENGEFEWYNKETKEKVAVNLPFDFAVLDELTTAKGYSEKDSSGIWANEIKDLKTQVLTVRTSKGVIVEGLYNDIKAEIDSAGGGYTRSLYIGVKNEDGEWEIQNIQLKGAAFSGWLDFTKEAKQKIYTELVSCHSFSNEKKGKVTYTCPQFKLKALDSSDNEALKELDRELQAYLKYYFDVKKEPVTDYQD